MCRVETWQVVPENTEMCRMTVGFRLLTCEFLDWIIISTTSGWPELSGDNGDNDQRKKTTAITVTIASNTLRRVWWWQRRRMDHLRLMPQYPKKNPFELFPFTRLMCQELPAQSWPQLRLAVQPMHLGCMGAPWRRVSILLKANSIQSLPFSSVPGSCRSFLEQWRIGLEQEIPSAQVEFVELFLWCCFGQ